MATSCLSLCGFVIWSEDYDVYCGHRHGNRFFLLGFLRVMQGFFSRNVVVVFWGGGGIAFVGRENVKDKQNLIV